MMLPLQEILHKYNLQPKGVVQIGCHWAEEHDEFLKVGIRKFIYVEPCKEAFIIAAKKVSGFNIYPNNEPKDFWQYPDYAQYGVCSIGMFYKACGSEERVMPMYVSHQNQGQSNSLLEPNLHLQQHPEIIFDDAETVDVIPLDKIEFNRNDFDLLMLDVQGFEGEVLKGSTETLRHINVIYTEVNRGQTYAGNIEIDEMDSLLEGYGFKRVETHWPSPNWTWGDAVYIKQ